MSDKSTPEISRSLSPAKVVRARAFTIVSFLGSFIAVCLFGLASTDWGSASSVHDARMSFCALIIGFGSGVTAAVKERPIVIGVVAVLLSLFMFFAMLAA